MIEEHNENVEVYDEDIGDYFEAHGKNNKQDPGASRHRSRIPVYKLKLENEADIPEKPKDILPEPSQKHYEKEIKEVDDAITKHKKNIEALDEQIKKEKFGDNPEIARITKEKDDLKALREPILKKIEELELKLQEPKKSLAKHKAEKEQLGKEIDVFKMEHLTAEIKGIQQKLGFSSLSISEEKKLIDRKARLEAQKPRVQKYAQIVETIKLLHEQNEAVFAELKSLYETKNEYSEKIKKFSEKIKTYLDTKKANDPKVNILKEQIKSIKEEIKNLHKKKDEIRYTWDEKWRVYQDQQYLLKYIKEATEKIAFLKKKKEREDKRREREEKENQGISSENQTETKKVQEDPLQYEIWLCDWLATYFKNLNGDKSQVQSSQNTNEEVKGNSKIDEDISKGLIKPFTRTDDDFIGVSGGEQVKKKTKAPKVSKREQKSVNSNLVCLDIAIIKKIQEVGLTPPVKKTEIPNFVNQLENAKEGFKTKAQEIKSSLNEKNVEVVKKPVEEIQISKKNETAIEPSIPVTTQTTTTVTTQSTVKEVTPSVTTTLKTDVNENEDEEYEEIEVTEEVEEEVEEK